MSKVFNPYLNDLKYGTDNIDLRMKSEQVKRDIKQFLKQSAQFEKESRESGKKTIVREGV